ncbi:MAG: aldehyde ferredoxin oxidoreductase family protein, partial [Candidatus Hodarchaeota archaeon]
MYGWTGVSLRIDLTTGKITREETASKNVLSKLIGGKGIASWRAVQEQGSYQAFSPENRVFISTGPLQGTNTPAAGRFGLVTKSPLTNAYLDTHAGGYFGPYLKFAGYDMLIIQGRAENPCYLTVFDDEAELLPANELWGKTTHETEDILKQNVKNSSVLSIGPAGENLVRIACLTNDKFRNLGRGGAGAIFGYKNLKAIQVGGTKHIPIANEEAFQESIQDIRNRIKEKRNAGVTFFRVGTPSLVDASNSRSQLPTRNFQSGQFDDIDKINASALEEKFKTRAKPCYRCSISCARILAEPLSWADKDAIIAVPEYETLAMLGSNCGNTDLETIIRANHLCNTLGLDTISTGNIIGFFIECCEKNLVPNQFQSLILKFGDGDGILHLIEQIARRKEGISNILGEGVMRASEHFPGSSEFAINIKGLEMAAWDPRGKLGMGVSYAVAACGASHLRGWPATMKPPKESALSVIDSLITSQNEKLIKDCLVICH